MAVTDGDELDEIDVLFDLHLLAYFVTSTRFAVEAASAEVGVNCMLSLIKCGGSPGCLPL